MIRSGIAIFLSLIWSAVASAHSGGTSGIASVAISGNTIRYSLTLHDIPPGPLAGQMRFGQPGITPDYQPLLEVIRQKIRIANGGATCTPSGEKLLAPSAASISITGIVIYTCAGEIRELRIRDDMADVLGASHHSLTLLIGPEGSDQFTFEADMRELIWSPGQKARAVRAAGSYFPLGFAHVLGGYDLLLVLLVLMLRGGGWVRQLGIIAAFTAAHSAALGVAVFDLFPIPDRLAASLLAASIAYVAAENLFPKYAITRRWAVSLVIGSFYGIAFALALRDFGLPRENLAASLLSFNLGIDAGQAFVVLLIVPILVLTASKPWEPKLVAMISAIVLAVGLSQFFLRTFFVA